MSANVQTFTEIFRKCSHVCAGGTRNMRGEIESAVEVVLDELTSRPHRGELIYVDVYRLTFNAHTAAGQFVEFPAFDFLRRIHRRHLVYLTAKTLECCLDLLLRPSLSLSRWSSYRSAGAVARIG